MTYHYDKDVGLLLSFLNEADAAKNGYEATCDGKYIFSDDEREHFKALYNNRYHMASELRAQMVKYYKRLPNIGNWNKSIDAWEASHKET